MSSVPPSPGSPFPPPPRATGLWLAIVLLILALILVVSGITLYVGARYLSRAVKVHVEKRGEKQVSVQTPVGSLEVGKEVSEASLGLPIYPGARRIEGGDTARVNIEIPGAENIQVLAAEFETSDPLDKVKEFYSGRLGSKVTKYIERSAEGKTVFHIKRQGIEKVVSLKSTACCTRIELVRVAHGKDEAN
jgi:hypothetical protein